MIGSLLVTLFCVSTISAETDRCQASPRNYDESLKNLQARLNKDINDICHYYEQNGPYQISAKTCRSLLLPHYKKLCKLHKTTVKDFYDRICAEDEAEIADLCSMAEWPFKIGWKMLAFTGKNILEAIEQSVCKVIDDTGRCNEFFQMRIEELTKITANSVLESVYLYLCQDFEDKSKANVDYPPCKLAKMFAESHLVELNEKMISDSDILCKQYASTSYENCRSRLQSPVDELFIIAGESTILYHKKICHGDLWRIEQACNTNTSSITGLYMLAIQNKNRPHEEKVRDVLCKETVDQDECRGTIKMYLDEWSATTTLLFEKTFDIVCKEEYDVDRTSDDEFKSYDSNKIEL